MTTHNPNDDLLPPRATPQSTGPQQVFARPPRTPRLPQQPSPLWSELSHIGFALLQFIGIAFVALVCICVALVLGPDWSAVVLLAVIAGRLLFGRIT